MQLHEVRRADLTHKKKLRIGRGPGSGIGKTSGRGLKGATARSGWTMKASYEGGQMPMFRRLPKRGFRNGPFRQTFAVVNVGDLGKFAAGSSVGPKELRDAGLIQGRASDPIKVLGDGDLAVALNVTADGFSQSALAKIAKAGGKAAWIGGAPKKPSPDFKKLAAEQKAKAAEKSKGAKPGKPEGGKPGKPEGAKPGKPEGAKPGKPEGAPPAKSEAAAIPAPEPKAEAAAAPAGKPEEGAKPATTEGAKPPKQKAPRPPKAEGAGAAKGEGGKAPKGEGSKPAKKTGGESAAEGEKKPPQA